MPECLQQFDSQLALERAGGNRELAAELFTMLCQELPTRRSAISAALDSEDMETLHHHAHKLHGSTLYCGVPALQEAVTELSTSLKRGWTEAVGEQVHAVLAAIDEVLKNPDSRV
ncbi:MAG TPA: Hpt domain-containing protein [Gammaproteobacteria bacterium]|nr:Hpt domain-containing protein [Gammaproteobacteria bacterium]